MGKYILKRLLQLIPCILAVSFIVFFLMSFSGDAASTIASPDATQEEIEQIRESLGLNDPLLVRYFNYMKGVFHGDLGKGLTGKSVWDEFWARMPYTIALALASMLLLLIFSIPLGIIAALNHSTWVDTLTSGFSILLLSIPSFWLGLLLMLLFAVRLQWLPVSGAEDGIKSIIMPAICAGVSHAALLTRTTRTSMLDQLNADYLRTARAKGVSERKVVLKHALGNALIPIITIVGNQLSILFAGTVAVETVFAWPGVGYHIVSSIRGNDFTMVTGCVLLTTVFVSLVLLGVDILYAFVDPRIKARYTGK